MRERAHASFAFSRRTPAVARPLSRSWSCARSCARNRGETFQDIATRLNLVQVEPAQGGQAWYPATIRAVLNTAPGKRIAAEEAKADDLISDEALKRAEERSPPGEAAHEGRAPPRVPASPRSEARPARSPRTCLTSAYRRHSPCRASRSPAALGRRATAPHRARPWPVSARSQPADPPSASRRGASAPASDNRCSSAVWSAACASFSSVTASASARPVAARGQPALELLAHVLL